MQPRWQAAGSVCLWRQVVVLPLCVCLMATGHAQGSENQVLSIGASETERLRDLLSGKQINALFADGSCLEGRVKAIQDGLLTVDIKKSTGPNPVPRGLQDISMDRISSVQFTRYQGKERTRRAAWFALGAIPLAAVLDIGDSTGASAGLLIGMGALGYLWGKKKDKQNVTLMIQQPDVSGGP